jgi:hypothetical protein
MARAARARGRVARAHVRNVLSSVPLNSTVQNLESPCISGTVILTGTKLAHQARAAVVRGI